MPSGMPKTVTPKTGFSRCFCRDKNPIEIAQFRDLTTDSTGNIPPPTVI
jgi:hypothetical protein